MPEYADIYCRQTSRDESFIHECLDFFLPERLESANEYEFPQYAEEPDVIFTSAEKAIAYLAERGDRVHTIYWRNREGDEHVMVSWLVDGSIIFGRSTPSSNTQKVDLISKQFVDYFSTHEVVVTYENYPRELEEDFSKFYNSLPQIPNDMSIEEARRAIAHRPILS